MNESILPEQCSIRSFTTSDGVCLRFRHWPALQRRGIVVALHGIQSHSGWYQYSSAAMAQAGFEVYFADRRGSGLNAENRGHADHGMRLVNDVRQLIALARREHMSPRSGPAAALPLTLLGLSWGGKIAAATVAVGGDDVDRLALLYPGLRPKIRPTRWQTLQLRLARHFDVRHKRIPLPLDDASLFTASPHWQQMIRTDPLALHEITTGLLNAGRDLDQMIARHGSSIVQPLLLMLAGDDDIIDNSATREIASRFASTHVTTILYEQARHTLEFEPDRDRFRDDLVHWLSGPAKNSPSTVSSL